MSDRPSLMTFNYKKPGEVVSRLRELYRCRPEAVFVYPHPADRPHFEALVGQEEYFGRQTIRYFHWDHFPHWLAQESGTSPPRSFLDSARRWLVLHDLLKQEITRFPRQCPPAVATSAFLPVLEQALLHHLREDYSLPEVQDALGCGGCNPDELCRIPETVNGWVCRLQQRYLGFLKKSEWYESAQSSSLARYYLSRADDSLASRCLVLVGFLQFTRSQRLFLKDLIRCEVPLIVFSPSSRSFLFSEKEKGVSEERNPDGLTRQVPVFTLGGGDRRMELAMVLRELILWSRSEGRLTGQGVFPGWQEIGLVVPVDCLSLAREILERYRVPWNLPQGRSASESRLGDLLHRFLRAVKEGWSSRETALFLHDPLLGGEPFPLTRALTMAPRGADRWRAFFRKEDLDFDRYAGWFELGTSLEKGIQAHDLLQHLELLLDEKKELAGLAGRSSRTVENHEVLDQVVGEVAGGLAELRRTIMSLEEPEFSSKRFELDKDHAIAFLTHWIKRTTLPPPQTRTGCLTLYPGEPPLLARHQVMAVTAVEADRYPGSRLNSPLEGEGTNVFSPLETREQVRARFHRLVATGEQLTILSYALQDDSGRPKAVSSFLAELFEGEEPWARQAGSLESPLADVLFRQESSFSEVEVSDQPCSDSRSLPNRLATQGEEGMLSDLDEWLECPFRVGCRRVFGLRPVPLPGVNLALLGEVVHQMWEKVPNHLFSDSQEIMKWLRQEFSRLIEERYPAYAEPRFRRHKSSLEKKMTVLAEGMADLHQSIASNDLEEQREYRLPKLSVGGVTFRGVCDRLLILGDRQFLLFDYKLGKSKRVQGSKQLGAYALSLNREWGLEPAGFYYLCHQDGTILRQVAAGRGKKPLDVMEEAQEGLTRMAEGIRANHWPASPESKLCPICPYSGLCRKEEGVRGGEDSDE